MTTPQTLPWWQDDPDLLAAELAAMQSVAPQLQWIAEGSGRWQGPLPLWPFPRPVPSGLVSLVQGRAFLAAVLCSPAHPMSAPVIVPLKPEPPVEMWGLTAYHLLPSGALCLLQSQSGWDPSTRAADLIPKASAWYIEFSLIKTRTLDTMPEPGIATTSDYDHLLTTPLPRRHPNA